MRLTGMRRATFPLLLLLAACTSAPPAGGLGEARPDDQVALTDGMRVSGTGTVIAAPDRPVRFCGTAGGLEVAYPPGSEPAPRYCDAGIDVVGVDLSTLTEARTKEGATEGTATLTGTFSAGMLTVDRQQPPTAPPDRPMTQAPPCPEPAGGWPAGGADGNLPRAEQEAVHTYATTHPEKNMFMKLLRPTEATVVFGVAVQDEVERAEAERLLRPTLGDGLCLVDSRVTSADLDAARQEPDLQVSSFDSGGPITGSSVPVGDDVQPYCELYTIWVTPDMRAAADRHPAGLVVFRADLRPV